jgi:hypothetical protein
MQLFQVAVAQATQLTQLMPAGAALVLAALLE